MSPRAKRVVHPPQRESLSTVHVPAPTGGLNTVDPAAQMPPGDSPYAYNVIGGELGLRARLGHRNWATGLTGASDNTVRTILPFVGSHKNGSSDKLFAVTSIGIWDVTAGGNLTRGVQPANTRALWRLDEDSALLPAADALGVQSLDTFIISGRPSVCVGKYNNGRNFRGVSYIAGAADSGANAKVNAGAFTVRMWVWINSYPTADAGFFGLGPGLGPDDWVFAFGLEQSSAMYFGSSDGYITTFLTIGLGAWHHLVVTYAATVAGSQTVNVYVDGVSATPPFSVPTPGLVISNPKWCLAGSGSPSDFTTADARFDEVAVINVEWNAGEVAADYAASTTTAPVIAFPSSFGDAGYGTSHAYSTVGGKFLLFCDETNGLYVYTESTASWAKVASGVTQVWEEATDYEAGNQVVLGGNVYICTTAGVSGTSGPTGTGTGILDGTVFWDFVSVQASSVIGPSLADQQNGFAIDPEDFCAVTVWKSRLWFVERDSTRGWYMDVGSLYGTATSFDFGVKMRAGGSLSNLFNWSYDGGTGGGLETYLVGISAAGDIVIYQGTDPSSADTFGLKGTWYCGGVPYGRRIAIDYGGDILILSLLGVVPLSKLVVGTPVEEQSQYKTRKIANLFSNLAKLYRNLQGWSIHQHPTDNALLICYPTMPGANTSQLAMSFATQGWSQYRNLPIVSGGVWAGQFYIGTADGRVCINDDYLDAVAPSTLNDATYTIAFVGVDWSFLTAFTNGGNARQKQVAMLRPSLLSQLATPSVKVTAKYNFDTSEPSAPTGDGTGGAGTWDNATWDSTLWASDSTPYEPLVGATGMGRSAAIAVQGKAVVRTTFVGVDVFFDQGGIL